MRRWIALAGCIALASGATAPGAAAGPPITGSLVLYADHSACAAIFSADPFVGSFTVTGAFAGPGTATATMRTVQPIVGAGSWSYCAPGVFETRSTGAVSYVLHAHSGGGDFVDTRHCVIRGGVRSCV